MYLISLTQRTPCMRCSETHFGRPFLETTKFLVAYRRLLSNGCINVAEEIECQVEKYFNILLYVYRERYKYEKKSYLCPSRPSNISI